MLVAPSAPLEFFALLIIIPIILLSFLVVRAGINSVSLHLLLALLFSMGGDVLLEMNLFVPGLSSFLFAQLFYGSLFLRYNSSWSADYQISLLLVGASLVMAVIIWSYAGDMRPPVIAYLLVITFMGLSANTSPIKGAILGAAVFILSDSIIAIDRFVMAVPASGWLIMISYYVAQFLLVGAVIQETRSKKRG
ncbi:MAG: lysoplasmalogenase [Gammaproteobacteria bacterium]|nr:lysoplasmalogenase [Gammaproteobacteria bacterium]